MTELQPLTPPALSRVVRTCLEKNPDHRFHTAHDLWLNLEWIEEGGSAAGLPAPVVAGRKRRERVMFAGGALLLAALAAALAWALKPAPVTPPGVVSRFPYVLPEGQTFTRTGRRVVAISPDGTKLAYIANNQIYLRHMHELEAQPIRGTAVDPVDLTFSPDGQSIAFFVPAQQGSGLQDASLKKVAITGGALIPLCPAGEPFGLRWQGDRIVFSVGNRILAVPDTGGATTTLVSIADGEPGLLAHPQFVNDGRALLYTIGTARGSFTEGQIVVQSLPSGTPRVLVQGGMDGRLVSSGHLLWVREGVLMAQPINLTSLQPLGGQVPIVDSVRDTPFSGAGFLSLSDTGTLAYVPGTFEGNSNLVWVDRKGVETPTGAPPAPYAYARISPDKTRIVANTTSTSDNDIVMWDLDRKTQTRLTQHPDFDGYPVWSPDSRSVIFQSSATASRATQGDLYRRAADGTGVQERLTESPERKAPMMMLDAHRILVRSTTAAASRLTVWPVAPGDKPQEVFSASVPNQLNGEVSPNGRWIAYQSAEGSTRDEIHVRPFPATDNGHWSISSGGGSRPMWSNSGRELFYVTPPPGRLMRVEVEPNPADGSFKPGRPEPVPIDLAKYFVGQVGRNFHISADDKLLLMIAPITAGEGPSITLVTNWIEELKTRVRVK
jgi:dipeptidyl aminopeptidase/acylaminoacyl peptidase